MPIVPTHPSTYGVPTIVTRDVEGWDRKENALYRGDSRRPDEIRAAGGFGPPNPDRAPDLAQHVGGEVNHFVSTSTVEHVGTERGVVGALYVIQAPGGILTDPTMEAAGGRGRGESEVLFPGGIDWRYVSGWHEVNYDLATQTFAPGPFIPNPDYIGNSPSVDSSTTPPRDQHTATQGIDASRGSRDGDPPRQDTSADRPDPVTAHAPQQVASSPTVASTRAHPGQPTQTTHPRGLGQPPAANTLRPQHDSGRVPSPVHNGPRTQYPGDEATFGPAGSEAYERQQQHEQDRHAQEQSRLAEERTQRAEQERAREQQPARVERPLAQRLGELSDERLDKSVRPHVDRTPAGMSIFDSGDGNQKYSAKQVAPIPGTFVVDIHGSERGVKIGRSNLSADDLGDILMANPDWDRNTPILLVGCGTGKLDDGFAGRLAERTGAKVIAPTTDAWVDYEGNVFASDSRGSYDKRTPQPTWPPNGEWRTFAPDGTQTTDGSPYPDGHTPTWGDTEPDTAPSDAYRRGDDESPQTHPTAQPDPTVEPAGPPARIRDHDDDATKRSLQRENESAQTLAKAGYQVEQNPKIPGDKNPDYRIEGRIFDNYAPGETTKPRNIASEIQKKVDRGQTDRVILNLTDSLVDLDAMRAQLHDWPIAGLKEIIVIDKAGNVLHFYP